MTTELFIYDIGLGGSPTSVNIGGLGKVEHLKDKIFNKLKKELPRGVITYRQLTLYKVNLKTGVVEGKSLAERSLEALRKLKEKAVVEIGMAELDATEELVECFGETYWEAAGTSKTVHVLVEHADVQEPPAKRARFSTADVLEDLRISWARFGGILPEIETLSSALDTPLEDHEKIPIAQDTSRSGRIHDFERIALEPKFTVGFTLETPSDLGTEASFINFWDNLIRNIIAAILSLDERSQNRNSNFQTSTLLKRPDLILLLYNLCLFRGEEMAPGSLEDPKAELADKLDGWVYGSAPYIFGYYARGADVTFVAISKGPDGSTRPEIHDLRMLNFRYRRHRITNLIFLIRMSSLLPTLGALIGGRTMCEHNKSVELQGSKVHKVYFDLTNAVNVVEHLTRIYDVLEKKKVPHVDKLYTSSTKQDPPHHWPYIRTGPVGNHQMPRNRGELYDALKCVLEALHYAHSSPETVLHRDIRWDNIIKHLDNEHEWFLIDWEHSSSLPTEAIQELSVDSHCPTVFHAQHGCEVDIWAVGKLILDARTVLGYTTATADLGERIMNESLNGLALADVLTRIDTEFAT